MYSLAIYWRNFRDLAKNDKHTSLESLPAMGLCHESWGLSTIGNCCRRVSWETKMSWLFWPDFNYPAGRWGLSWGRLSTPVRPGEVQPDPQMTWMSGGLCSTFVFLCPRQWWSGQNLMLKVHFSISGEFSSCDDSKAGLVPVQADCGDEGVTCIGVQRRDHQRVWGQSWRDVPAHVVSNREPCSVPKP